MGLPSLLHGPYSEAYYNNITNDITFQTMKTILLTTGGYSFAECINSFPLKYRTHGSKSLLQWFNSWRYKFSVILEHLPFFGDDPADLDAVAQTFATIGVLAGMPTELRETVLNRDYDTLTFINDCNTVLSHSEHSDKPKCLVITHHRGNFTNINNINQNFITHLNWSHFHSHHSSSLPSNSYHSNPMNSQYPKPHYQSQQHQQSNNQHGNRQATPPATLIHSQPFRDLSSVTCYKCNQLEHYADKCPLQSQQHSQGASSSQPQQHNRPIPVPRKSHSTRCVTVTDKVDDPQTATNVVITPLNCHDEEDIVTQGIINGIHTSVVIDSGAK